MLKSHAQLTIAGTRKGGVAPATVLPEMPASRHESGEVVERGRA
jgi:hypothetical protein